MKKYHVILFFALTTSMSAQTFQITSPDGNIRMTINYEKDLFYSVDYKGKTLIGSSPLGFELKGEDPMRSDMSLLKKPETSLKNEAWTPVVKNKHEKISLVWNEAVLSFLENNSDRRRIDIFIRVYDNGVAFSYSLYGARKLGDRQIIRELTGFSLPESSSAWVTEPKPEYRSSQESEFIKKSIKEVKPATVAGLPFLVEVDKQNYIAITEANIDNYPGFYIGSTNNNVPGQVVLTTKLSPLPEEDESGVKARFSDKIQTPWRVIMIGDHPGKFIESEIIHGLNPPCAISDPSWIKPGTLAFSTF